MEKIGYLYKITHPITGKSYIGATQSFKSRIKSHIINLSGSKMLAEDVKRYPNIELASTLLCVGSHNFVFEIEEKAIQIFNTRYPNGYNLAVGGRKPGWSGVNNHPDSLNWKIEAAKVGGDLSRGVKKGPMPSISAKLRGHVVTALTRLKISAALVGRSISPEHRAAISAAVSGERNGFFGKKHDDVTRNKMRGPRGTAWTRPDGSVYIAPKPFDVNDVHGRPGNGHWWTCPDGTTYVAPKARNPMDIRGRPMTEEQRCKLSQVHSGLPWSDLRRRRFNERKGIMK